MERAGESRPSLRMQGHELIGREQHRELADPVAPWGGQGEQHERQVEQRRERHHGSGRVPDDRAERDTEQGDGAQADSRRHDCPQRTRRCASEMPRWCPERIAWLRKNDPKESASPRTSVIAPTTPAFAANTAPRRGTAVNVVRICPVPNSEVKVRTPSTPSARTGYSSHAT